MARLRRDRAGNTLAIMAAALVPLIGFSGSAVDMARLYVVKVRLQQACDAGALAGRKTMSDTSPPPNGQALAPLDDKARDAAKTFFKNNFADGWFGNANAIFTPSKTTQGNSTVANAVYATATVDVPMTLMKFFGKPTVSLAVSCQALYDLADADVMFVLDTTGSMSCYPTDSTNCATATDDYTRDDGTTGYHNPEKSATTYNGQPLYSKIESLRRAVLQFDTTMRANADPSTHVRYGFVTYASAVNVGGALSKLSTNYLQNTAWTYQSRHVQADYNYQGTFTQNVPAPQGYCPVGQTIRMPTTGYVRSMQGVWDDEGYYQARNYTNITYKNGTCSGTGQRVRALWRYEPTSWDTSGYAAFKSVANPTRLDGSTSLWRGCVEELNTSPSASFSLSSLPDDLNPDVKPTDPNNKWRPIWSDAEWFRNGTASQDVKDDQISEDYRNNINYAFYGYGYDYSYGSGHLWDKYAATACGMPVQRLTTMTSQQVHDYLYDNDFTPAGGTYHDVGMIWGTRMLSPDSVFADSKPWAGRNDPTRTIVFMTDGTMSPTQFSYGQYGVEMFDNRIGSNGDDDEQTRRHIARLRIECDAAKKKGFTIYTVAVGVHGTAMPDLDYCSTQGTTYFADDSATLTSVFATIAQRVAKLRISK